MKDLVDYWFPATLSASLLFIGGASYQQPLSEQETAPAPGVDRGQVASDEEDPFARPTKSQDQQMDRRNTVPKGYETHIILGSEADRPRAEFLIDLYKVFEKNPTGETLTPYLSDRYIQHSTGVPNGRNPIAMLFASSVAQYDVKIDIHKVMVVGDWAMAHVNFRNVDNAEPDDLGTAAVDMYFFGPDGRVEEHWDVLQQVPTHSANPNGMFVKIFEEAGQ